MTPTRPRLLLVPGDSLGESSLLESLRPMFDVVEIEDAAAAARLAEEDPGSLILLPTEKICQYLQSTPPQEAAAILQFIGEGVGVVDDAGSFTWMNSRLGEFPQELRQRFSDLCRKALGLLNSTGEPVVPLGRHRSRKFSFHCGEHHYELVTSPASADPDDEHRVSSVVGVVWDVTASRRLLEKLDAIDAAGSELMKIEAAAISKLTLPQRLKLLEDKIVHFVHDLLEFDHFEVRLLDRETNRLELVIAVGITPERIGEVIFPEPQGSGISGYVAATGESYLCAIVKDDPLYREGLDDAASSLTVPLKLHDRVIGVFNIESKKLNAFDENDRQFATIFGRYVAMAMNILDLLLVERYTTNERLARTVLSELDEPLDDITNRATALREEHLADGKTRKDLDGIIESVGSIRRRIESCTAGPRTILGAEQELSRSKLDPSLIGKRVLVADDEATIRKSVAAILAHRGCDVTVCCNGSETMKILEATRSKSPTFDLIISDIKMPDYSGYEVFCKSKQISPATPVILMTGFGYDPHHSIVRASQAGLHSFLFKPFKAEQLLTEVKKALVPKRRRKTQKTRKPPAES